MTKNARFILVACLLVVFSLDALAQIGFDITEEDRQEFARHRAALYEKMGDQVAVFFGAYQRVDALRWRQDNNFYYLTGVEIPFSALIMDGRRDHTILFLLPAPSSADLVWSGRRVGPGPEAAALFGIDDTRLIGDLEAVLQQLAASSGSLAYLDAPEESIASPKGSFLSFMNLADKYYHWAKITPRQDTIAEWLRQIVPGVTLVDITQSLYDMRGVKTAWELARVEEVCRIAVLGHIAAMKATKPKVLEYEIEAAATAAFIAEGALELSFSAIVASGPNTFFFHYMDNSRALKRGELVHMDYAPCYRYYVADVARTWPVSGKFSARQRRIYDAVLDMHERLIAMVAPGVTLNDLCTAYKDMLAEKGYTWYYNSPTHYVGMTVHDPCIFKNPLQVGNVIVIEPAISLEDEGWGVHVEDMLVVTETGCRVLTGDLPIDPDEIEALMAGSGKNRKK